jgi:hypothetical protein
MELFLEVNITGYMVLITFNILVYKCLNFPSEP